LGGADPGRADFGAHVLDLLVPTSSRTPQTGHSRISAVPERAAWRLTRTHSPRQNVRVPDNEDYAELVDYWRRPTHGRMPKPRTWSHSCAARSKRSRSAILAMRSGDGACSNYRLSSPKPLLGGGPPDECRYRSLAGNRHGGPRRAGTATSSSLTSGADVMVCGASGAATPVRSALARFPSLKAGTGHAVPGQRCWHPRCHVRAIFHPGQGAERRVL
jgi:hypothetical protein